MVKRVFRPRKRLVKKRRMMRKRAVPRGIVNNRDYARAHQTLQLANDTYNTIYKLDDINLSQFDRLCSIAEAYQYFRINMIEMQFQPLQDTYFGGAASGAGTVPYFFYVIDKQENLLVSSFQSLEDAGAKPIRFDEKNIVVRWKPRISDTIAANSLPVPTNAFRGSAVSPWLPTNWAGGGDPLAWNASQIPHKGLLYGVQQAVPGAVGIYATRVTVHMEFARPNAFNVDKDLPPPVNKEVKQESPVV